MTETIRVFVGCDPNDCDLEQMMVLDYSRENKNERKNYDDYMNESEGLRIG